MRKFAPILLILFLFGSFVPPVFATQADDQKLCAVKIPGYTTARITNSKTWKHNVVPLENGAAAWEEQTPDGEVGRVVLYNGVSEKTLAEKGHAMSAAGANKVVWLESVGGSSFISDVYYFDGTTVKKLTTSSNDEVNYDPIIDTLGNIAWINMRVDSVVGVGSSSIKYFNTKTTQTISSYLGFYNSLTFTSSGAEWMGVKDQTSGSEEKKTHSLWSGGNLTEIMMPQVSEQENIEKDYIFYIADTDGGLSRGNTKVYNKKTKAVSQLGTGTEFAQEKISKDNLLSWLDDYEEKTFLWDGSKTKNLSTLLKAPFNNMVLVSFSNDKKTALADVDEYIEKEDLEYVSKNQTFIYDLEKETLTQFTDAPVNSASGISGATGARHGKNSDIYWTVSTPETNYAQNDICHAVLGKAAAVPAKAEVKQGIQEDDVIKSPIHPSVYYYKNGKRRAFPNEGVFFSWYKNFDNVKTVTAEKMESIPLDVPVSVRPKVGLVKFPYNSNVYEVTADSVIKHIPNEQAAISAYGASWSSLIVTLPEIYYLFYSVTN
jgi:hypothetical protein